MKTGKTEVDDGILVQMHKDGDSEALGLIFERYKNVLKRYIFKIVKDYMQAEDILQDTFLKILLTINAGKYTEQGTLKSWLFTTAHNLSINYLRKKETKNANSSVNLSKKIEVFDKLYLQASNFSQNPEEIMISLETEYDIQDLLNKLPREQKEVVILRIYNDLKFEEIAEYMNCPSVTNRVRMIHALSNLKKQIIKIKNNGQIVLQPM